jgi:hypothetical protein
VRKRLAGVYGLNVFNGIASSSYFLNSLAQSLSKLNIVGVLDHFFAFSQPDVRFLPIAPETFGAAAAAELSVKICRANVIHLYFKNSLYRFLDFRLGGI